VTDPKRWSDPDESNEEERQLVLAGRTARMPDGERRALWAGIALSLMGAAPPVAAASGPAPVPAPAASGVTAYLTKGLIFLATVSGLTLGALRLWPSREAATSAAPGLARSALSPAPVGPAAATPSEPVATTTASVDEHKPRALPFGAPSSAPASRLREESGALLEARAALRAGDAARSLALLEQARVRYPHGALGQEREALAIRALAQSGDRAAAARRARAFLQAHPQSPYVADVRLVATP